MCNCCCANLNTTARTLDLIAIIGFGIQILLIMFKLKTESTLIHNVSWFIILIPFWIAAFLFVIVLCMLACSSIGKPLQWAWAIEFILAIVVLILTIFTLQNEGSHWPIQSSTPDEILTSSFSILLIWHTLLCVIHIKALCKSESD